MSIRDATQVEVSPETWLIRDAKRPQKDAGAFSETMRATLDRAPEIGALASSEGPGVGGFVEQVNQTLKAADRQVDKLARGEGNVHETAISLEKAGIEMRLLMRGRDKVVQAYQEIMRMNV